MNKRHILQLLCLGVCLGACHRAVTPPVEEQRPDRDAAVVVAEIRAAGTKAQSSVEVKPLRDPAVEGLLKQAHDLEAQGQPQQALDTLRHAEKVAAISPEIIQYEAELLIELHDWNQAELLARKSWELGPKVGALCARNQQTLVEARTRAGDKAGALAASQQVTACSVQAPGRY